MTMRTFDLGIVQVNGEGDWLAASLAITLGFFAHGLRVASLFEALPLSPAAAILNHLTASTRLVAQPSPVKKCNASRYCAEASPLVARVCNQRTAFVLASSACRLTRSSLALSMAAAISAAAISSGVGGGGSLFVAS